MPDRYIRANILTSDRVDKLSYPAEVFYRRAMSAADDYGRYDGRPSILLAALYPLRLQKVKESDIKKWLKECVDADLINSYEVEKREFIEILKFGQRLRAKKSKFPDPLTCDRKVRSSARNSGSVPLSLSSSSSTSKAEKQDPTFFDICPQSLRGTDFQMTWIEWMEYRKEIKKPIKKTIAKKQFERLSKFEPIIAIKMLNRSMENSWTGIFDLPECKKNEVITGASYHQPAKIDKNEDFIPPTTEEKAKDKARLKKLGLYEK